MLNYKQHYRKCPPISGRGGGLEESISAANSTVIMYVHYYYCITITCYWILAISCTCFVPDFTINKRTHTHAPHELSPTKINKVIKYSVDNRITIMIVKLMHYSVYFRVCNSNCTWDEPADSVKLNPYRSDLCLPDLCSSDLCSSDLCLRDLCSSDLCSQDLCSPDLCLTDLCSSDLCSSDLCSSDLCLSDLCLSDLYSPDLCSPDLCLSDLCLSDLYSPDLCSSDQCLSDLCSSDLCLPDLCLFMCRVVCVPWILSKCGEIYVTRDRKSGINDFQISIAEHYFAYKSVIQQLIIKILSMNVLVKTK